MATGRQQRGLKGGSLFGPQLKLYPERKFTSLLRPYPVKNFCFYSRSILILRSFRYTDPKGTRSFRYHLLVGRKLVVGIDTNCWNDFVLNWQETAC